MISTKTNADPPVTILVPVRNGARWIPAMLESLLAQEYRNFEILMVDDVSTDDSAAIARSIAGSYLRVIKGGGLGLASALAVGVTAADTELICRMDVDDVCSPKRLVKQIRFMRNNSSHVMLGSNVILIDMQNQVLGRSHLPTSDRAIRLRMLVGNPFAHSSVVFRREAVLEVGNYWSPDSRPFPEDYHLWARLADLGRMGNLRDCLVYYRRNQEGIVNTSSDILRQQACEISLAWAHKIPGGSLGSEELEAWRKFYGSRQPISVSEAGLIIRAILRKRIAFRNMAPRGLRLHDYLRPLVRVRSLL